MKEVVHVSRSRITREEGPTRKAIIEGFPGEVYYGVPPPSITLSVLSQPE
jgi:hypothetical protein